MSWWLRITGLTQDRSGWTFSKDRTHDISGLVHDCKVPVYSCLLISALPDCSTVVGKTKWESDWLYPRTGLRRRPTPISASNKQTVCDNDCLHFNVSLNAPKCIYLYMFPTNGIKKQNSLLLDYACYLFAFLCSRERIYAICMYVYENAVCLHAQRGQSILMISIIHTSR